MGEAMKQDEWPIGARVRRFGTIPPIAGTVVSDTSRSDLDGGPRQYVRWETLGAPTTAWDPALLFPIDSDVMADPDEIVSGDIVWRHPRLYPATAKILPDEISLFIHGRTQATPMKRVTSL